MTNDMTEPNDRTAQEPATSTANGEAADPAADRVENETVDSAAAAGAEKRPDDTEADKLRRERDDYYDRLLRKTAEFDNYRKRIERERREQMEWASADILNEILAVLDDFDRALTASAPPEAEPYRTGVELIHRQLSELVRKRGAVPIDALGADFDPNLHQAVAYEEVPGARDGEVVAEFAKGYKLGDRLLRPAMVKVAKAK